MPLLVLRSLAVYGGAAALAIWLAHRFVLPLRWRVALVLACAPLLFTGKAMLTGAVFAPLDILYDAPPFAAHRAELRVAPDRAPVLGDIVYQMIPWQAADRRALAEHRMPLWNPSVLAGDPLLAMQQPAVLRPGAWIGLLLPLPQACTFEVTLRLLIALLCAHLFLRDLGCGEMASLLGALGWAFSDFFAFFLGWGNSAAVAPFPLLLLGARRIVAAPGARSLALLVVGLVLSLTGGHPESSLHACAGAGLYVFFQLPWAPPGRRLLAVGLGLLAGVLALGLCAVLVLPMAEVLPQTAEHVFRVSWYAHAVRSVSGAESLRRLAPQLVPYAMGVSGHGRLMDDFVVPSAYAGSLLFPFAVAGLLSRRRARWFFLGLLLLGLAVCTKTVVADLLTKLPLFDIAINEYLIFLVSFSICALAALGADRLGEGEGSGALAAGAVGTLVAMTWLFLKFRPQMLALEMPRVYIRERAWLGVVPLVFGVALVVALPVRRRATIGLAAVLVIFATQRTLEAGGRYPTMPANTFYPSLAVLDRIPRGAPDRMVALGVALVPNIATMYGLEDVRGYEAMTLNTLKETYPIWCTQPGIWFNRVDEATNPFLAFLNVRWVLTAREAPVPAGWPVLAEDDGMRLIENPLALPRAFVPRSIRSEPDPFRRMDLLKAITDFREQGVTETSPATAAWSPNGDADVRVASYGAQTMDLEIVARKETLVGTSVPAWRGWKAAIDGRSIEPVAFNHAFLAFRVPEGAHRLSLRYAPDGFRRGLAISLATLVVSIGGLALLGRRSGR
jgi:hypothetical protein